MGQAYAIKEKLISKPFAEALALSSAFRAWVIGRTKFAASANDAVLLDAEMMALRNPDTANWWVSHHHSRCDCFGCKGGKETDILAVFAAAQTRFALHFEVKQPGDQFKAEKRQPEAYKIRAACWVKSPPARVLPHQDAATILICSPTKLRDYKVHRQNFDETITIQEIGEAFPGVFVAS
jgi:hypothetical protein